MARCITGALMWSATLNGASVPKLSPQRSETPPVWDKRPSFEQLYEGYDPGFSRLNRARLASWGAEALRKELTFSRQKYYLNIADVQMDAQVRPIIEKANELVSKQAYRRATELYRRILRDYPEDLFQIAEEGIFIPATLYVQRRILAYPKKELAYYRMVYDPAAKDIYERCLRRYSVFDYKELVTFHLATSYGDDALFALGNDALDAGRYDDARRYYEEIVAYHGEVDDDADGILLDRNQVWVRLAICYRHLGRDDLYRRARARIRNTGDPTTAKLLQQLERFQYDAFETQQREGRRSARYEAADDRSLSEPMPYRFSANRGEWKASLSRRPLHFPRRAEPDVLPWVTETDLIYKDMNVLYSRSLLTGEINWIFGPGGSSFDSDRYTTRPDRTTFYPSQAILVHDGVVFAHLYVYGPSLVAVDQYTGRLLWSKGPIAATSEDEWLDRYQASPAAVRGAVIVPVVHDDIRGRSHIASTADLAAFQSRTGKRLWRKTLSCISPLKITQSRYPRKIRILSTTPAIRDGVAYHVTNAGVVAAVDVLTGEILWLTRYPQRTDVLDNLSPLSGVWRNEPPVVRGDYVYVTPVDCNFLLCLERKTGKIVWQATRYGDSGEDRNQKKFSEIFSEIWRLEGFTSDGLLCLSGYDLVLLDPLTGRLAHVVGLGPGWITDATDHATSVPQVNRKAVPKGLQPGINGEGEDFWWPLGSIYQRVTRTRDGRIYFSMQEWFGVPGPQGPFNSEYTFDLAKRAIVEQRRWYDPAIFIQRFGYVNALPVTRRPVNEEPESFDPAIRMCCTRWGVPFCVDVTYNHIVVRYDRATLEQVLAREKSLENLFGQAERARHKGDIANAIALYESCKLRLPSEEDDRRRHINLRLYPLYTELARWGHQAGDLDLLERACKKLGATASNPMQEIKALLAYAELHEKRGDALGAIRVLQNASRHYWKEPLAVSRLALCDRQKALQLAQKGLERLLAEVPPPVAAGARQIFELRKMTRQDYFLSVANVSADQVVETRSFVTAALRDILRRAPAAVRQTYEAEAAQEVKRYEGKAVDERILWCWPEADACRKHLSQLITRTDARRAVERQALLWRYAELAEACGLGTNLVPDGKKGLEPLRPPCHLPSGSDATVVEAQNEDSEIVRLALPQKGNTAETAHLLFVGGRKRKAYGNRFAVLCWNMKENRKEWESRDILLHGPVVGEEGFEVGFEEIFIHGDLAIVHGLYDVIALEWKTGKAANPSGKKEAKWHFRVPLGFEIRSVNLFGDVLILCGRGSTIALSPTTGDILWEEAETGEYYAGPFVHHDVVLSIRTSPSAVSFRTLGSGRLLTRLALPGLTTNRKHPIFAGEAAQRNPAGAEAVEAYPVACAEGTLAVSDGKTFYLVDLTARRIRWATPATKLDLVTDPAYRMWIHGGRLFVLKPYYSVLENAVYATDTGELLWRRREGGKKVEGKLKQFAKTDAEIGQASVGLVLSSMVFVDNVAYGIRYEMGGSSVTLVGMDPASGKQLMEIRETGYTDPEAYVEPSWSAGCVVVRIQDGNRFELWQVDVKQKKIAQKLTLEAVGRLGEYGDVSAVWQGPYLALWGFETRRFTRPSR